MNQWLTSTAKSTGKLWCFTDIQPTIPNLGPGNYSLRFQRNKSCNASRFGGNRVPRHRSLGGSLRCHRVLRKKSLALVVSFYMTVSSRLCNTVGQNGSRLMDHWIGASDLGPGGRTLVRGTQTAGFLTFRNKFSGRDLDFIVKRHGPVRQWNLEGISRIG